MMFLVFKDAFEYTFKNKKSLIKLGILSVFSFLTYSFIFNIRIIHRIIEIGTNSMIDSYDPIPDFKNPIQMIKDGCKIFIVAIIYLAPAILITLYAIANNLLLNVTYTGKIFLINTSLGFLIVLVIIYFISYLFLIIPIPNMINKESLTSGFEFKEILAIIKSVGIIEYIKFCIYFLIILVGTMGLFFVLSQFLINGIVKLLNLLYPIVIDGSLSFNIFFLLFLLLLFPCLVFFKARAIALLYDMR